MPKLAPGRHIYFDLAQYKCTAQRMPEPDDDDVYVVISLNGAHFEEFICDASLTTEAIRILTARKIFEDCNG
jgi:hypothetical protein